MSGATLNDTTISSITVEIDAPAELVWAVVVDFPRYGEWNPFCVRVDTDGEIGSGVLLHVPDPNKPGETFTTQEYLRVFEAPHHLQYDTGDSIPGMFATRDQWVTSLGEGRSSYFTTDVFAGEIAQVVHDLQADWVKAGFDAMCLALKARAEALNAA